MRKKNLFIVAICIVQIPQFKGAQNHCPTTKTCYTGNNMRASLKMELPTASPWHCVSEILGPVHHQIIVGIAPDAKGLLLVLF
jgi:hypothetical protein